MVVFVGTGKDILAVPVVDGFVVADVKFAFVNPELSRLRKQSAVQPRDIHLVVQVIHQQTTPVFLPWRIPWTQEPIVHRVTRVRHD